MRIGLVMAVLAVLGAQLATAQTPSAPTPEELIDASRPVMAPRELTADERALSKKLISQIDKSKDVTLEMLEQLRPMASAGDKASIAGMFRGAKKYWYAGPLTANFEAIARSRVWKSIQALWALRLWEAGERTREVAQGMMLCLERDSFATYGDVRGRDCGVNVHIEGDYNHAIDRFADGDKGAKAPGAITIADYALAPKMTPEQERARFDKWVAAYSKGSPPEGEVDARWVQGWLLRQGPAVQKEWSDALDKFWAIKNAAQGAERVAGEERHKQKIADWDALNAKRVAAKADGKALPPEEEERFVRLSFELGDRHIVPIGMERVLLLQSERDDFCRFGPAAICERQRNLAFARENAAMEERVSRENAWKYSRSGGDVSVRTYDQNGNYVGSASVPAWQADILTGK